ncbi:NACHT [Porites harrisoni]
MEGLKDLLAPKTLHWFSYVANVFWILLGIILSAIFLDIEISEPRFDFRCGSNGDKELVRGKCYEQYDKQYNKFPVYGFVIINFIVTASVCGIYSQAVKSRVEELERDNNQDVERQTQRNNNLTERKLFKAYRLQLLARIVLGISFVLLQTKLLYTLSFPSNFNCNLTRDESFSDITASASRNETPTQTSYECHNQRAAKKTFWADAVIVVTGSFAFLVFIECLYLLSRAQKVERFKEDPKFHKYYLSSTKRNPSTAEQEQELLSTIVSNLVATSIEQMKKHVREVTKRPYQDLKSPFDDPGEGRDLKLDEIFTNLIIYKGRAHYNFSVDRGEQLKEYYKANEKLSPTLPGEIFDREEQKILVVGRPGIGKTMFSTKILRDWASDNLLNETQKSQIDFKVAFLVKLRMFNFTDKELTLRELLDHSEYSTTLSEETWSYIRENPQRVLIIFDGFDEYSRKAEINKDDVPYRNSEEHRMPVHFLLEKILSGKFLTGATVLMTTRPNAVSCIRSPIFDKTVEILGFTTKQVEDYVEKFSKQGDKAETIKQHITSNSNLQAFCYIPVNCFIICSCLLELLGNTGFSLPTRLTEIYSIAIKMFYFSYDDNQYRHDKAEGQQFFLKPFNELSSTVQEVFKSLGEIAFNGIKNGRLIFESHEVKDLKSNGLFHRLPDTRERPFGERREQYCFLHLTMQEFLAAKYLVDTYSSEDLQKFVSDHIQYGAWKVVMQFVAGLLDEKEGKSTDIFSDLLPSKTDTKEVEIKFSEDSQERSETLTCWPADEDKPLVVMLFNCMYENKASGRKVQEKLAKIDGCNALNFSKCNLSPLDCLALVHALKSVEGILYFDLSKTTFRH